MSLQSTQYFLGNTEIIQSFVGDIPIGFNPKPIESTNIPTNDLIFWLSGEDYVGSGNWLSTTGSVGVTGSFFGSPTYDGTTKTFSFTEFDGMTTGATSLDYKTGSYTIFLAARYLGTVSEKHGRILVSGYPGDAAPTSLNNNWTIGNLSGSYTGLPGVGPAFYNHDFRGFGFVSEPSGSYDTTFRIFTGTALNAVTSSAALYVNGVLLNSKNITSGSPNIGPFGFGINSGSYADGPSANTGFENSKCEVGDIIFYDRVMDNTEITQVYDILKGRYGL